MKSGYLEKFIGFASACLVAACDAPSNLPHSGAPIVSEPSVAAEPVAIEPVASKRQRVSPKPVSGSGPFGPRTGVVTAGDIDDALNIAAFRQYQRHAAKGTGLKSLDFSNPYSIHLVDATGRPASGVSVTLRRPGAGVPFYSGRTDVDGSLLYFPHVQGTGSQKTAELRIFRQGVETARHKVTASGQVQQFQVEGSSTYAPEFLDMVFVIDVSGSMGDELAWLTREFDALASVAKRTVPDIDVRLGLVAYQSPGDPFVVRNFGMTRSTSEMRRWLRSLSANGGSGGPEVVGQALSEAVDLRWRRGNGERLIFQIGDEPPSKRGASVFLSKAQSASRKGVEYFGIGASETDASLEFLMRQAALATGGRYIFLTDDSGIGNAHAEPRVSCYRVTRLKSLLIRVLQSELTGQRIEPKASEIIRTVGNYSRGVCAQ